MTVVLERMNRIFAEHTRRILHIYDGEIVRDEQVAEPRIAGDSAYRHRIGVPQNCE